MHRRSAIRTEPQRSRAERMRKVLFILPRFLQGQCLRTEQRKPLILKDDLLKAGYDVLMIREGDDVQLDNIARSVIANNCADLHIAIHFDSTQSDKGIYFCSVPEDASYRSMEPVASMWQEHMALGQALISAFARDGYTLFDGGMLPMDLTQTSYSTIPSVDIELGDTASDHSPQACDGYAKALKDGIDTFFAS